MDMQELFHMNHGVGEFSYAQNSSVASGNIFTYRLKVTVKNAIKNQLLHDITKQYKVLNVADLGCGVGPTPIAFVTEVIETVNKVYKEMKSTLDDQVLEVKIYMSDLPSTDFNTLFEDTAKLGGQLIDGMPLCFVMGAPGSFYGRLFTTKSLHFVHSSFALHWLSQVPLGVGNKMEMTLNKGSIFASETSTPYILNAYYAQFNNDFTSFLTCRSQEVVPGGHMLLSLAGRDSSKPSRNLFVTHLSQALACLVSKGVVTEEKLDSFNLPLYCPCKEEIEDIITEEGSFVIKNIELTTDVAAVDVIDDTHLRANAIAKFIRSITEALVSHHFGAQIWNVLKVVLYQVILDYLISYNNSYTQLLYDGTNYLKMESFSNILNLFNNEITILPLYYYIIF